MSIVGYNTHLNYAEALRRCPEGDPTGEQLAAVEKAAETWANSAERMCSGIDPRQRHSMQDLLDRLTRLTPLKRWSR